MRGGDTEAEAGTAAAMPASRRARTTFTSPSLGPSAHARLTRCSRRERRPDLRTLGVRDAGFQGLGQGLAHRRQLDAVEDVLEEAADDQPLGVRPRETAGHRIEE